MSRRFFYVVIAFTILCAIIVCITVPLVIRRNHSRLDIPPLPPTNVSIILPLYIYPSAGAWDALYDKLSNHAYSGINWTIIINPASGPGYILNNDYGAQLSRLRDIRNVITVGYVFTDYGRRNIKDLEADVQTYSSWNLLDGIFFDETPQGNQTIPDPLEYLAQVTGYVRTQKGLHGSESIIIHNPGTPLIDPKLLHLGQNYTIIIEDTYEAYQRDIDKDYLTKISKNASRNNLGCLLHSIPYSSDKSDIISLLGKVSQDFRYIFLTDLTSEFYHRFGAIWDNFVNATSLMQS